MWQVNKLQAGFEVRHTNGKRATEVIFETSADAQSRADYYNKSNLGFCPICGTAQIENLICSVCAAESLRENPNVINNRVACCSCTTSKIIPSSIALKEEAFFEYRPNEEMDRYYCGCRGWD